MRKMIIKVRFIPEAKLLFYLCRCSAVSAAAADDDDKEDDDEDEEGPLVCLCDHQSVVWVDYWF